MKIADDPIGIALGLSLVVLATTICTLAYNSSKKPTSLELLTKYLITKDSLMTKQKLDSLKGDLK